MIIGRDRIHFVTIGSTNDEVLARAKQGAVEGLVVTAEEQTAGRGRRGRAWVSPAGMGLHCSVLLRPPQALKLAPHVTMLAALAGVETARTVGITARVKWPNDMVVDGRKLGGVLTEVARSPGQPSALVVGIGINVNHLEADLPPELRVPATSLRMESGREQAVSVVIGALLCALDRRYRHLLEDGPAEVLEEFRRLEVTLRKHVQVFVGEEVVEGEAECIDETGALGVRTWDRSLRLFVAGEVTVRPK